MRYSPKITTKCKYKESHEFVCIQQKYNEQIKHVLVRYGTIYCYYMTKEI